MPKKPTDEADTATDTVLADHGIEAAEHRDERHDSIDRVTGTLTEEAAGIRAEHGISQAGEQLPEGGE